jgi:hypothetical protein
MELCLFRNRRFYTQCKENDSVVHLWLKTVIPQAQPRNESVIKKNTIPHAQTRNGSVIKKRPFRKRNHAMLLKTTILQAEPRIEC